MLLHLKKYQQDISRYHVWYNPVDFRIYHKPAYAVIPEITRVVLAVQGPEMSHIFVPRSIWGTGYVHFSCRQFISGPLISIRCSLFCHTFHVSSTHDISLSIKSLSHPPLGNDRIQNSHLATNLSLCFIPISPSLWMEVKSGILPRLWRTR